MTDMGNLMFRVDAFYSLFSHMVPYDKVSLYVGLQIHPRSRFLLLS
jgi:hypothetical protein